MSRALSRGSFFGILVLTFVVWTGCTEDRPITGPSIEEQAPEQGVVVLSTGKTYAIEGLGTLGGSWSEAFGVNASDWVVGVSETSEGYQHAFVWTPDGGMQDINGPSWFFSRAEAVNSSGMVVGWGIESGVIRGFYWTEADGMQSIGVPSLHHSSYCFNVNEAGVIAGMALSNSGNFNAIVWRSPSNVTILGSLGGTASRGLDLNEEIRVAGKSTLSNTRSRATLWIPQEPPLDLGTLGGRQSEALGINEISQVVGWADDDSERTRPFLWPVGSEMVDLNTLGGDEGEAHEINDAGFTVGWSEYEPALPTKRATLWTPDGEVIDLGGLEGGDESFARDINSTGTIVGWARDAAGDRRAVMWALSNGTPATVEEILVELKDEIRELGRFGTLWRGVAHSLITRVLQVERKINEGEIRPAINQLGAFINEVNALVRSRRLSPEQGARLIELAEAAIAALESGE